CLVYDPRGGRVSPAIEVHGWIDPPAVGRPYDDPTNIGIQALGVAVRDLDAALERLASVGATLVGRSERDGLGMGAPWAVVRAPDGVTVDVVERDVDDVQLSHLRVTCSDLTRSSEWYAALGWSPLSPSHDVTVEGDVLGLDTRASGRAA